MSIHGLFSDTWSESATAKKADICVTVDPENQVRWSGQSSATH